MNFMDLFAAKTTVRSDEEIKNIYEGAIEESKKLFPLKDGESVSFMAEGKRGKAYAYGGDKVLKVDQQKFVSSEQKDGEILKEIAGSGLYPKYYAHGKDWVLMEKIEGVTLEEKIEKNEQVILADNWREEYRKGLEHSFDSGYLAKDLHPGNIMITEKGEMKIIDVGNFSKITEYEKEQGFKNSTTVEMFAIEKTLQENILTSSEAYQKGLDGKNAEMVKESIKKGVLLDSEKKLEILEKFEKDAAKEILGIEKKQHAERSLEL